MLITAMLMMVGATPVTVPKVMSASDDPPIRVWLDADRYQPGDRATVKIRLADDGYVLVLRADTRGHLRILFPLDPSTDNYVKGGRTFEVRGRGDREAFQVDDDNGSGTVFAAVSQQPFTYSGFVLGDHWDYRVLESEDLGSDPEAAMVDLVHNMAGGNHFDYDVTTYTVATEAVSYAEPYSYPTYAPTYYPCWGCGPWYGGTGIFINFGYNSPYYYNSCWYDPFWCDFYGYPYGYSYYRPYYGYYHNRYTFYASGHRPFAPTYRPPFVVPRRTTVTAAAPRRRWDPGTSTASRGGRPTGIDGRSAGIEPGRRGESGGRSGVGGGGGRGGESGRGSGRNAGPSRPEGRPASPQPGRGGHDAPPPRGRNHNDVVTRANDPVRQEPARPDYRPATPAPRPVYRPAPAPRPEYRPAPAPRPEYHPAPAPRPEYRPAPAPRMQSRPAPPPRVESRPSPPPRSNGGGGGGGGGGGRGRHGR